MTAVVAGPASAAPAQSISGGTGNASWSVQPRWIQYVKMFGGTTSPALPSDCVPGSLGTALPTACAIPLTVSDGTYDAATGDAAAALSDINFEVPAHGISLTLSDISIAIDGASETGTVSVDISGNEATTPAGAQDDYVLATLDLASATVTPDGSTVSYSGITGTVSADAGDYIASWSAYANTAIAPLAFSMSAPSLVTTTAVTSAPAATTAPIALGTSTTVTAAIDATTSTDVPTGAVDFYDVRASAPTAPVLLAADVPVNGSGVATYSGALIAGGHKITANYKPAAGSAFIASTVTTTTNYAVYDASVPAVPSPSAGSASSAGISASWAFSDYSNTTSAGPQWAKSVVDGNVSISSSATRDFVFTNGVATYADGVFQVAFDATFRVTPNGMWLQFADPILTIGSDGRGVWTADLTTVSAPDAAPVRTTILTVSNATIPDLGGAVETDSIDFDYFDSLAVGTWNAAYGGGWANAFLIQVPSSIRAYFYQSSATGLNLSKPPRPLVLDWSGATTTVVSTNAPSVSAGGSITATAAITGGADGVVVQFSDGDQVVGTGTLSNGSAAVTFVPAIGSHSIVARYLGDASTGASTSTAVGISVTEAPVETTPETVDPAVTPPVVTAPVVTAPVASTPAAVVKVTPKVTLKAATFTKATKPKVSVTLPKLANGKYATGNVRIYVNGKSVKVIKLKASAKGKVSVTLPKKYSKSIKVKVKFGGNSVAKAVTSKTVKYTVKKTK